MAYEPAWLMQINANKDRYQFNLPGAIDQALARDRTLWLENRQNGESLQVGHRIYLWSSGIKGRNGKSGQLIAVATVVERPQPHAQEEWQAEFRAPGADYDPNAKRVKLFCEGLVNPALDRADVLEAFPRAPTNTDFFRNGHTHTTARVEPALDKVLRELLEGRLANIDNGEFEPENWPEGDLRRRSIHEIAVRDGQPAFRNELLLTRGARCAFTGTPVRACLQAAHIRPYQGQHSNQPRNGLLLRADVHLLFDRNLIRIDPETLCIHLHESLMGTEYAALNGRRILDADRIDVQAISWRWQKLC